ncbi:acetyltransferase [Carbonactinospora thermoautotrophica]|uniref:Acetyltransferase n=1 Tax=Carbonactinospora thermoautotrophica TaxID=1469144 RepID=A0A132N7Y7_9ACTN|nr:GNAT family N-acetyltransferase [Carbonactinospora thermoautotrophica]KWW97729.1 acetyltransferase [Carbonactinospora thermoautotrophica]KWW98611.1 GCN5-related N-acetyltransferase [Carbonactinospora thermoautotrophica]KWX06271.1 acetyltransferase [Carbonactinospora thermoautotrophica]
MAWFITEDLEEYLAAAGEFLGSRPVEHTLLLSIAHTLRVSGVTAFGEDAPLFGWWRHLDGRVDGAFLWTPPRELVLTRVPRQAAEPLAEALALGYPLPGVNAHADTAEVFAAAWRHRTGAGAQVQKRLRLYRLGELTPPRPTARGGPRLATAADRELLLVWWKAFCREVGEPLGKPAPLIDDRIGYGGLTLWEVDGTPVSMAGLTRQVAGMVRVGPVYTPPESRRRGYAAAVTAAVSRAALDAGAGEVVLFTDVADPAANTLYQRLGYQPVQDRIVLSFTL